MPTKPSVFSSEVVHAPKFAPGGVELVAELGVGAPDRQDEPGSQLQVGCKHVGRFGVEGEASISEVHDHGRCCVQVEDVQRFFLGHAEIQIVLSDVAPVVIGRYLFAFVQVGGVPLGLIRVVRRVDIVVVGF